VNPHIVVPALTIRTPEGSLDTQGTAQYARRAASTWVDRFILSGTTARGYSMTEQERLRVLRVWLDHTDPARVLACCWSRADVDNAATQGVTPIVVIPHLHNDYAALRFLASLPAGSFIYSHPGNSPTVFDAQLCSKARSSDCLPVGAKLSKMSHREIAAVRAQAGPSFILWDGSSQDIAGSIAAGATGVVTTPLSPITQPFPPRNLAQLQAALNEVQTHLDRLPSRDARSDHLSALAVAS
jgi:dihydrodipicolinate synthase/N-acetylneuraminate lyase